MYLKKNKLKHSVRFQVLVWYLAVLSIILVCCVLIMQISFSRLCTITVTNNLKNIATLVSHEVEKNGAIEEGELQLPIKEDEAVVIYDGTATSVYGNEKVPTEVAKLALSDQEVTNIKVDGKSIFVYDKKVELETKESIWVRCFVVLNAYVVIDRSIYMIAFITIPIIFGGAMIGALLITKKIFRPINELYDTAKEISESGIMSKRIQCKEGQEDELTRLTQMFNQMFDRLSNSFESERQFTMDASHELRTPLTVIRTQAEYLEDSFQPNTKERRAIGTILKQTKYMGRLVNSLLFIARMENQSNCMKIEEVDMSELVTIVVEEMQETAHEKAITIRSKIQENIKIQADQAMLVRVFMNLISNAIQYGRDGGFIIVTITQCDNRTKIQIEDNGIGIKTEELPKIWNRFYQVDASQKKEKTSMGLGLFMVKKIIEMHHGTIAVESKYQQGTKFSISL